MADPLLALVPAQLRDARARSLALASDLTDEQWLGPRLAIVNPLLWEIGHLGWFQEFWTLRHARGRPPLLAQGDQLYDSAKVAHDTRWDLPLLPRADVLDYLETVLQQALSEEPGYFHRLALFHEDMHGEAFTYTRQTLGYPAPRLGGSVGGARTGTSATIPPASSATGSPPAGARPGSPPGVADAAHVFPSAADLHRSAAAAPGAAGPLPGDVEVPGARFLLGPREGDEPFVFDNEKWAHPVDVATFRIARAPVTNDEFAAFVDADGYGDPRFWSPAGWRWRLAAGAQAPRYWFRDQGGWLERRFDRLEPLAPHRPVIHVSWFEADAFCRWAGRRLPTEAEWELAAATPDKRRFPWGDEAPDTSRANLDGAAGGTVDVACYPEGDSAAGCRQMIGNVWEWTASDFQPYPGFVIDPYKEYSAPWFASPHKVLRGGSWATRGRLLRNTWRNFFPPERWDVPAGFRTCAEL